MIVKILLNSNLFSKLILFGSNKNNFNFQGGISEKQIKYTEKNKVKV